MMGEANLRFARGDKDDAESICKEIIRQCEQMYICLLNVEFCGKLRFMKVSIESCCNM